MKIILLGAPGAGKGTQAQIIAKHYSIPHISTGAMFREAVAAETPIGVKIKHNMENGILISDDIVIALVEERLQKSDCDNGYLLDGFPRTIEQADALNASKFRPDCILEITVLDQEIVKRLTGRLTHPASGRIYHKIYNPPKVAGKDDITGEPLITRKDDSEETVKRRLEIYHNQTEPLVAYYRDLSAKAQQLKFISIDGHDKPETISENILSKLQEQFS